MSSFSVEKNAPSNFRFPVYQSGYLQMPQASWITHCTLGILLITASTAAVGGSVSVHPEMAPEQIARSDVWAYEHLIAFRDSHPVRFDENHQFFGQLLTDSAFMDAIDERWQEHRVRIEYYAPYLGRVLFGHYVLTRTSFQAIDPPDPIISVPPPDPPAHNGSSGSGAGGKGDGGGHGHGIKTFAVPEPCSLWLLFFGASVVVGVSRRIAAR